MSERNTGLFLPGHVAPEVITRAFLGLTSVSPDEFKGEEAPRVGHGTRAGLPYTHVGLRFFEKAGLLLMDEESPPAADEVEMHLGQELSKAAGQAVFVFYDEETPPGGAAIFANGRLVERECWDGRDHQPLHRHMKGTDPIEDLDTSDWIWRPASDTIERLSTPIVGPGLRTDDEINDLIEAARSTPIDLSATPAAAASPSSKGAASKSSAPAASGGKRARLKGLLGRLRKS